MKHKLWWISVSYTFTLIAHSFSLENGDSQLLNPVPYALSPTYLMFLAKQERKIYNAMDEYKKALEKRLELVRRYTKDYEDSSIQGTSYLGSLASEETKDHVIASNPILSYRMLNRYANEFLAIGANIRENAESVSSNIVYQAKGVYDFPSLADAGDAMQAILRMQFIYDIKADNIAEGNLPGCADSKVELTTNQCYQLAKLAQKNQHYTLALDWFNVTKSKLEIDLEMDELEWIKKSLPTDILHTISEHDRDFQQNYEDGFEYIYSKKVRSVDGTRPTPLRDELLKKLAGRKLNETHPDFYQTTYINHIALCNGANFQTPRQKAKLRCWYDSKRNPYWAINPLKIELVNSYPPVVQIYDIISEKWMSYLKNKAYSTLERAPGGPNATPRTAAYAWFKDWDIPDTPISRRIEFITGLNVVGDKASEALQIAAYAFGGHVELHFDSKGPNDPNPDIKGDRVTTFLLYLNNVTHGGYTSFPKLGFAVKPVQGSAVLWYTNLKNGGVDEKTLHGACPLIYGHKWIGTKWTHINENILKQPCDIDPLK